MKKNSLIFGFIGFFLGVVACQKPKCPSYMTSKEFAAYEANRNDRGSRSKRDKDGHIKKSKGKISTFRY